MTGVAAQVIIKRSEQKKKCPICKEWFPRPPGKSDKVWEKQDCCGKNCAAISRRKDNPVSKIRRKPLVPGENRFGGYIKKGES